MGAVKEKRRELRASSNRWNLYFDIRIFRDQQLEFAYIQSLNTLDALLCLVSVSQEDGGDNV